MHGSFLEKNYKYIKWTTIGLFFLMVALFIRQIRKPVKLNTEIPKIQVSEKSQKKTKPQTAQRKILRPKKAKSATPLKEIEGSPIWQINKSKETVRNFKQQAYINIDLPEDYLFENIDIGSNDTLVLHGKNKGFKSNFTVIASQKSPSPNQILSILKANNEALPSINTRTTFNRRLKPKKLRAPRGFRDVHVWHTNKNGKEVYAIYARRRDYKGSYLFALDAPRGYYYKNEERYFKILEKIKLLR